MYCGQVSKNDVGKTITVNGWVQRNRDHGGLIFIDLRDREGIIQCVIDKEVNLKAFQIAESVRSEYVLEVTGKVQARSEDTINPNIPTGNVEILIEDIVILNEAITPPFPIQDGITTDEMLRLKYRYLDLRRPEMQKRLILLLTSQISGR